MSANAIETLGQAVARANRADQTTRKSDRSTLFTQRALALAAVEELLEAAVRFSGRLDAPEYLREATRRVESGQ